MINLGSHGEPSMPKGPPEMTVRDPLGRVGRSEIGSERAIIEIIGIRDGPDLFGSRSSHLPFGSARNPNGL